MKILAPEANSMQDGPRVVTMEDPVRSLLLALLFLCGGCAGVLSQTPIVEDGIEKPPPSKDDEFSCVTPHGAIRGGPIATRPFARARIRAKGQGDLVLRIPSNSKVLGLVCYRTEYIFDKMPTYRCPLDSSCFGDGIFRNAYRRSTSAEEWDEVVVNFASTGKYVHSVLVRVVLE